MPGSGWDRHPGGDGSFAGEPDGVCVIGPGQRSPTVRPSDHNPLVWVHMLEGNGVHEIEEDSQLPSQRRASPAVITGVLEPWRSGAILVPDREAKVQVPVQPSAGKQEAPSLHPVVVVFGAVKARLVESKNLREGGIQSKHLRIRVLVHTEDGEGAEVLL